MKKRILSLVMVLAMLLGMIPNIAMAAQPATVYISISEDDQFVTTSDGTPMGFYAVTLDELKSIDLEDYGLGDYAYDADGDKTPEIVALHLYIYVHEQILGLDWSDITVSGGTGSIYFNSGLFGFFDENLRYDLNGSYPAVDGWGLTADQIVLSDGDFLNVAHYTDWAFWGDSMTGFHYFTDTNGQLQHIYSVAAGETLEVGFVRSFSDWNNGGLPAFDPTCDYTIYYGTSYGNAIDTITTDENGTFSLTFPTAGTWYLWADGGYGAEYPTAIVSAPAFATVIVTEDSNPDQDAADVVIAKINAIGTVTIDSEADISAARGAFDSLTDAQKALVTNIDTLTAAEAKLQQLKDVAAQAAVDQAAAKNVIDTINAIGEVTLSNEDAITAARDAFNSLTDAQKGLVDNVSTLTAAEAKLQQLKDEAAQAAEDQEKADAAEEIITAIGKVNIFAGNKVIAAREAYDALNSNQKALVENADVLITAETTLAQLYKDAAKADHKIIFETTGNYINKLGTPSVGSVGGEWMVIDLVRAGYPCPEGYYENVVAYVKAKINDKEQLHRSKGTDNSRVILALTAAGYDVTNVAGHNLLMGLTEMSYVQKQGINGPIWALIAFDSYNYEIPTNPNATDQVTREKLIAYILEKQLADGGWALSGKSADADMTGMAIQSLAPYYSTDAKVKAAVDKALDCLSAKQSDAGTYGSIDGTSVESCAQVVVALAALGIDAETDERFTKNGISALDALCLFAIEGGGFAHVPNGELNGMATEQGQYALAAYYRFKNGQTSLYDMSDVVIRSNNTGAGTVENATDSSANAHAGALEMSSESMTDALLTEEEKAMVSNGVSVQVDLDIKDISETVLKEDKTLIEKASGKNTVALYLDITLTKQLGTASPVKVAETTDAVTVSITVPTALRNNDTKIERSYKVIRVHEGKTDILDTVYDAKSGKLTFETNAFSTYALVYSDAPAKASSPQTGDTATPWLFAGMMVLSFCGITVLTNKSKKKFS